MKKLVGIWVLYFCAIGVTYAADWICNGYMDMVRNTYTGVRYIALIPLLFYAVIVFLALLRSKLCTKSSAKPMMVSLLLSVVLSALILVIQYFRPGNAIFNLSIAPLLLFMTDLFSLAEMRSKGEK